MRARVEVNVKQLAGIFDTSFELRVVFQGNLKALDATEHNQQVLETRLLGTFLLGQVAIVDVCATL